MLKVEHQAARNFYEIEAVKNGWSARQLERQINSLLFERLLKSRDQAGVLALANEGLSVTRPADIIKDPYVLEFLDLLDEKNQQIFASRYQFHLPSEETLRAELKRELDLLEGTEK